MSILFIFIVHCVGVVFWPFVVSRCFGSISCVYCRFHPLELYVFISFTATRNIFHQHVSPIAPASPNVLRCYSIQCISSALTFENPSCIVSMQRNKRTVLA